MTTTRSRATVPSIVAEPMTTTASCTVSPAGSVTSLPIAVRSPALICGAAVVKPLSNDNQTTNRENIFSMLRITLFTQNQSPDSTACPDRHERHRPEQEQCPDEHVRSQGPPDSEASPEKRREALQQL